jgi:ribokinase
MLDFVCVGDATQDNFLFISEAAVHCGLNNVNCQLGLDYGQKIPVEKYAASLGGNAANVAVGLSRLGIKTGLVTVFGDDERGAWIKKELGQNNINMGSSVTESGRLSNLSMIIIFGGERTILSYHAMGQKQITAIPDSRWVYLTSAPDRDADDLFAAVRAKKRAAADLKIAFNPAPADLKKGKDYLQPILDITDVLILNKEEAAMLGSLGPKIIAVTDGKNGATVYEGESKITKPAVGGRALEPTGAGDAFSSGFLAALFSGEDLDTALDWGLRNSASVIQKIGAIAGLLTHDCIMY